MTALALPYDPPSPRDNALQRTAVRVAMSGSRLERLAFGVKTLVHLMRHTEETEYVLALTLLVNAPSFPRVWMQVASSEEGRALLRERPSLDSSEVDRDALRALPEGTLGRAYVRFLDENQLDGDFFQAPPDVPDEVAFLSKRLRQAHDVWHAVTGYTPSVRDELALQAFTYGQLRAPHAILIVIGGLVAFGWRDPKLVAHVWRGFQNGKRAAFLGALRWESRWERPLEELRAELRIAAP